MKSNRLPNKKERDGKARKKMKRRDHLPDLQIPKVETDVVSCLYETGFL